MGLHAVTLVMCLSLIGISADYTTYYLMRRRWAGGIETPAGTLVHLRSFFIMNSAVTGWRKTTCPQSTTSCWVAIFCADA